MAKNDTHVVNNRDPSIFKSSYAVQLTKSISVQTFKVII